MPAHNNKSEQSSAALRVLAILETVARSTAPRTATEINTALKLPKPTIHRLCAMLEHEGFLQANISGKGYLPGRRLAELAMGIFSNNDHWRTERRNILQRVSEDIGETCNISIPEGSKMVYFDRFETHWPLRIQLAQNQRVPMHCTASGKLYLNSLSPSKRNRLLARISLDPMTDNTLTDINFLKADLKRIATKDIGTDNEEFISGMVAVAVPLRNSEGRFFGALAMHAPTARLSMTQALEHLPRLSSAAKELMELVES